MKFKRFLVDNIYLSYLNYNKLKTNETPKDFQYKQDLSEVCCDRDTFPYVKA